MAKRKIKSAKQFYPSKYVGATKFQTRFRPFCRFFFTRLWKFSLEGFEQIPTNGPAILCANHISFLDSVFLLTFSPRNMSVVGKSEYMDSFKTRWLFTKIGMIPLDRSGAKAQQRRCLQLRLCCREANFSESFLKVREVEMGVFTMV